MKERIKLSYLIPLFILGLSACGQLSSSSLSESEDDYEYKQLSEDHPIFVGKPEDVPLLTSSQVQCVKAQIPTYRSLHPEVEYLPDGCYQRAEQLFDLLKDECAVELYQVAVAGSLMPDPITNWSDHTSLTFRVKSNDRNIQMVVDPAFDEGVMTYDRWLASIFRASSWKTIYQVKNLPLARNPEQMLEYAETRYRLYGETIRKANDCQKSNDVACLANLINECISKGEEIEQKNPKNMPYGNWAGKYRQCAQVMYTLEKRGILLRPPPGASNASLPHCAAAAPGRCENKMNLTYIDQCKQQDPDTYSFEEPGTAMLCNDCQTVYCRAAPSTWNEKEAIRQFFSEKNQKAKMISASEKLWYMPPGGLESISDQATR